MCPIGGGHPAVVQHHPRTSHLVCALLPSKVTVYSCLSQGSPLTLSITFTHIRLLSLSLLSPGFLIGTGTRRIRPATPGIYKGRIPDSEASCKLQTGQCSRRLYRRWSALIQGVRLAMAGSGPGKTTPARGVSKSRMARTEGRGQRLAWYRQLQHYVSMVRRALSDHLSFLFFSFFCTFSTFSILVYYLSPGHTILWYT